MDHILDNITQEDIDKEIAQKSSRWKRPLLPLLTIFLILLVVSLSFYTFVNGDILVSLFTSYTLEDDNSITFKSDTIAFSSNTYEELKDYFITHQRNEFKA